MKILLLNQTFYPDPVATSQHLTDLAVELAARGHDVKAIAGRRGYDDASKQYAPEEIYRGVRIRRVRYTALGKKSALRRAVDFATFLSALAIRLCAAPRPDAVIALTSPPLVAALAAFFCRVKKCALIYWVMDLNPDEAVAAGWLGERSVTARFLRAVSRWTFAQSSAVVALDAYMKERIVRDHGGDAGKISIVPPWGHEHLKPVEPSANRFRARNDLKDGFLVMYSGNHSPCHPLDTVLEAAARYSGDARTLFTFIGGGSLVPHVTEFKKNKKLSNLVQLPYEPIETLSESLSSADLHVIVMGERYAGIVHPSKLYGILAVGSPFIYVGSMQSPIGDLCSETGLGRRVAHADVDGFCRAVEWARGLTPAERAEIRARSLAINAERFAARKAWHTIAGIVERAAAEGKSSRQSPKVLV